MNPIKPICLLLVSFLAGCPAAAGLVKNDALVADSTVIDSTTLREGAPEPGTGTIERKTGGSEVIMIDIPEGSAAPSLGTLVEQNRLQLMQQKLAIRTTDCDVRAQFAGAVVQMRDQDFLVDQLRTSINEVWPVVIAEAAKNGITLPAWYKVEYERIINLMVRKEPKDFQEFAKWFGLQCVKFGPWLNPAAR